MTYRGRNGLVFTEPLEQVLKDVKSGYLYRAPDGRRIYNSASDLTFEGGQPLQSVIPDLSKSEGKPWSVWWAWAKDDAEYYPEQCRMP